MQSAAQPPPYRTLIAVVVVLALASTGGILYSINRKHEFFSSPTQPRAWAEAEFLALTKPDLSPGKPTDPRYAAKCGPPVHAPCPADPTRWKQVTVEVQPAAEEYLPPYQIVDFNAADGFTSPDGGGKVSWLAARTLVPYVGLESGQVPMLKMFHPDGTPMSRQESDTLGMPEGKLLLDPGLGNPVLQGQLVLSGYQDAQWNFRQVFDSDTHVPLSDCAYLENVRPVGRFHADMKALHDAPLTAVFDLNHGAIRELPCKPLRGAAVEQPEFKFEVIETIDAKVVCQTVRRPGVREFRWPNDSSLHTSSVIYQVTPPSMYDSIILEASDTEGKRIPNSCQSGKDPGCCYFDVPLEKISSLRVRFRPKFTRLLVRIDAFPAVHPANVKPANLFDMAVPEISFGNFHNARKFIADVVQLKDVSSEYGGTTESRMSLRNTSPRKIIAHYIAMDPKNHKVIVDPVAKTIRFESAPKAPWYQCALNWLQHPTWNP